MSHWYEPDPADWWQEWEWEPSPACVTATEAPRDSYQAMRDKVLTTEHEAGVHPDYLTRMLACVTLTEPALGEGSGLDEANRQADRDAEARLATVRGGPAVVKPALPFMTRAASFMARFMTVMALASVLLVAESAWLHSIAGIIAGMTDVMLCANSARIFRNRAREGKDRL